MVNRILLYIVLVISLVIQGCGRESLEPSAFIQWVDQPENRLINEKTVGAFKFIAQYRPLDYMVATALVNNHNHFTSVDSLESKFRNLQYFIIKIGTNTGNREFLQQSVSGKDEYYERIRYYTSMAQQDILLVDDVDTLPCTLYHFERTYSVSPYNTLLLAFQSTGKAKNKKLIFNDQVLNTGKLIFTFNEDDINNVPKLKKI